MTSLGFAIGIFLIGFFISFFGSFFTGVFFVVVFDGRGEGFLGAASTRGAASRLIIDSEIETRRVRAKREIPKFNLCMNVFNYFSAETFDRMSKT